jgi:hypothetical protein
MRPNPTKEQVEQSLKLTDIQKRWLNNISKLPATASLNVFTKPRQESERFAAFGNKSTSKPRHTPPQLRGRPGNSFLDNRPRQPSSLSKFIILKVR